MTETVIETGSITEIVVTNEVTHVLETQDNEPTVIETPASQGPPGPAGGSSIVGGVSADQDNQLQLGTDGQLYVPPPQLASAQW